MFEDVSLKKLYESWDRDRWWLINRNRAALRTALVLDSIEKLRNLLINVKLEDLQQAEAWPNGVGREGTGQGGSSDLSHQFLTARVQRSRISGSGLKDLEERS